MHFHYVCTAAKCFEVPNRIFATHGASFSVMAVRAVKNYAPRVEHYVADVRVQPTRSEVE